MSSKDTQKRIRSAVEGLNNASGESNINQITATTSTNGENISVDLGTGRQLVDLVVDTAGSAALSIDVSTTGDFTGEESNVQTIGYDSAVTNLEQFDFAVQYIQASVDSNLNELTLISRGD